MAGRLLSSAIRQQWFYLACLAVTGCVFGFMFGALRDSGSSVSPIPVEAQAVLHDFTWHFNKLTKDIKSHIFHFDWKRQLPLLRLTANETSQEYRIRAGLQWMRTQNLVIAGALRNAMPGLPNSLNNVNRLRALFHRSWIVMVESDSTDQTREFLHDLSQRDPSVRLLGCSEVNSGSPCRPSVKSTSGVLHKSGRVQWREQDELIVRGNLMAALRNQYLEYTYEKLEPLGATLLLIMDADMTWLNWKLDNIVQGLYYFQDRPQLQQLCAHVRGPVSRKHEIHDPWSLVFYNNKHFGEHRTVTYENTLLNFTADLPPVKVASCFQAMAFYRLAELTAGRLMYGAAPGELNSEHSTLSRKLSEVYIDPQMRLDVESMFVGQGAPTK